MSDPIDSFMKTPQPIFSSSMKKLLDLSNDLPQRESDCDNSLGVLSLHSDDLSFSKSSRQRQRELEKARASLENYSKLPSRLLKPSEISSFNAIHSESTISESDLLFGNSSTPRDSLLDGEIRKERQSIGDRVTDFANLLREGEALDKVIDELSKLDGLSFKSGQEALDKLLKDEVSWKQQRDIPANPTEFSLKSQKEANVSVGNYFQQKSDNFSLFGAETPQKPRVPVPLIEIEDSETLQLSDIQEILSSEQSTTKALDKLLHKKRSKSKSPKFKEDIKENISPPLREKSIVSSRSSSSLSSLPNGRLPIATSKSELIWGCVKPGKSSPLKFIIRNKVSNRVGIKWSVSNPSFRLKTENSEINNRIILHPFESKTLEVTFSPTMVGPAVDVLNFESTDPNHQQKNKQFVKLYGYGGYGIATIQTVPKDPNGRFFMSLGNIDEMREMTKSFVVKNTGNLTTFACFDFILNTLYLTQNLDFSPKIAVLLPGEETEVVLKYRLLKKDFNYLKTKLNNAIIEVGRLQVIHGTEVDRFRLRRVCQILIEKQEKLNGFHSKLIRQFPGEMYLNLKQFKESPASIEELTRLIHKDEIIITFEQDLNQTVIPLLEDETTMFHSLCESTTILECTLKECQIEPSRIILNPPEKTKDIIFLTNNNTKIVKFEVDSPEELRVRPKEGTVGSGETTTIEVRYLKKCDNNVFKVKVLIDNECFYVDVKVVFL